MYTIPIGGTDGYNGNGVNTQGSYLARGEVIAPNCDPLTRECDIWVGLSWGGLAVRLSGKEPACWGQSFAVHQPTAAVPMAVDDHGNQIPIGTEWGGAVPYGAVIDCRGYLWGNNPGSDNGAWAGNGSMLFGVDTNQRQYNQNCNDLNLGGNIDKTGHAVNPPLTSFAVSTAQGSYLCGSDGKFCNGLPTPTQTSPECGSYGTAIDVQGRVWLARYQQAATE